MSARRWSILMWCLALVLAGCGNEEEIARYQVPRIEPKKVEPVDEEPAQLLAAILPQPERIWFLKVAGYKEPMAEIKDSFDAFVRTIKFTGKDNPPVGWTVPATWNREPDKGGFRYATFTIPTKSQKLELVVTPLGKEAASILDNVNRWRGQISLDPIDEAGLKDITKNIQVHGVEVTLVEIAGTLPSNKKKATKLKAPLPFTVDVPDGWVEYRPSDGINLAGLVVQEGGKKAQVTIAPAGGTFEANVKRWSQEQLEMSPDQTAEAIRQAVELKIDGHDAKLVDLANPKLASPRNHILGLVLPRGDTTWFIKMTGPTELVRQQKPAFESFVRSIRFSKGG